MKKRLDEIQQSLGGSGPTAKPTRTRPSTERDASAPNSAEKPKPVNDNPASDSSSDSGDSSSESDSSDSDSDSDDNTQPESKVAPPVPKPVPAQPQGEGDVSPAKPPSTPSVPITVRKDLMPSQTSTPIPAANSNSSLAAKAEDKPQANGTILHHTMFKGITLKGSKAILVIFLKSLVLPPIFHSTFARLPCTKKIIINLKKCKVRRSVLPPGDLVMGVVILSCPPSSLNIVLQVPAVWWTARALPAPRQASTITTTLTTQTCILHRSVSYPNISQLSLQFLSPLQGPKTKGALKGWGNLSNATPTGPMSQQTSAQKPRSDSTSTFAAFQKAAKEKADRFVAGDDGETNIDHVSCRERTLKEQQEFNKRQMERKEKERQKLEQEKRKEKEEEDALEQVCLGVK